MFFLRVVWQFVAMLSGWRLKQGLMPKREYVIRYNVECHGEPEKPYERQADIYSQLSNMLDKENGD